MKRFGSGMWLPEDAETLPLLFLSTTSITLRSKEGSNQFVRSFSPEISSRYIMASAPTVDQNAGLRFSTLPEVVPLPSPGDLPREPHTEKEAVQYQVSSTNPATEQTRICSRRWGWIVIAFVVILAVTIGTAVGVVVRKEKAYVFRKRCELIVCSDLVT
jgi:hypothetical protein